MEIQIYTQRTPNPKSLKFILSKDVILEGKAEFKNSEECSEMPLVRDILNLDGVNQVYLFENVITVSQDHEEWEELQHQIRSVIKTRIAIHDPSIKNPEQKPVDRSTLSPELQKIEEILDRTIRPGLQADGGDLNVKGLDGKELTVKYQGACGTCPSATQGTLYAIEDILKQEFDPDIFVTVEIQ